MTAPGVLLLDASGPESVALARAAAVRGHAVHAAATPAGSTFCSAEFIGLLAGRVLTDFARPSRAVQEITAYARRHGVGAVLTVNEYLTELAALVCAELALPGNDRRLAHAARDKAAMHRALTAAGVRVPYTRLARDDGELREALGDARVGLPCVIKPACGAGSAGVSVVSGPADAIAAAGRARAAGGMGGGGDQHLLVQAYAAGAEYSIESITQDGAITHLAVTEKRVTSGSHRVETGHSLPAHLPPEIEKAVYREADAAIRAVGIRHGPSHTEVMVGPDGQCTVIEIAARLAAGHIGFLIQHALGIDVFPALLDVALGRRATLYPTAHGHATVRFITSPYAGRLASVTGLPRVGPGVPFVRWRAAIGGLVHAPRANAHRLGSFGVTGPDPVEAEERADALLRRVRIRIDPAGEGGSDQDSPASTSDIAS
ncbi:ATP-grasp domain-containing protein [Streptomyces sp. MNP-20]|uniref:ATP-grasp domain-containing protein n=1 Tax=Streptomyces sp. MNP-20 TaxID=2721165 RepID=UPI0015524544|nr:ATP-grasp domain-containing protein [Streptomyces sp. MNP-20]